MALIRTTHSAGTLLVALAVAGCQGTPDLPVPDTPPAPTEPDAGGPEESTDAGAPDPWALPSTARPDAAIPAVGFEAPGGPESGEDKALKALAKEVRVYDIGEDSAARVRATAPPVPEALRGNPPPRFVDVTEQVGLGGIASFIGERVRTPYEDSGSGLGWADYDSDGDMDVYISRYNGLRLYAEPVPRLKSSVLMRNDGDGTFSDATNEAGLVFYGQNTGVFWVDYDGDRDQDLYLTAFGPNRLYRNDGGTFTDVTAAAGVGDSHFSTGTTWGDYDQDGDLDLYLCNYSDCRINTLHPVYAEAKGSRMGDHMDEVVSRREEQLYRVLPLTNVPPFSRPNHNVLFRNNGDGTFSDVSREAGVHLPAERSLNAIFLDLDDDGWLDVYVLSDVAPNNFYHNNGDGTFTEWSKKCGLWDWRSSMGMAVGDPDADMDFDFYLGFFAAEPHALLENLMRMPGGDTTGPLRYASREETWGVKKDSYGYVGWGTSFTDWDRDGDLDLFLVAGHVSDVLEPPYRLGPQRNLLYVNVLREEGWARMVDVTDRAGPGLTDSLRASRGIALVDFDNDGDEDVSCTNMQDGVQLLRNDTPSPYHWLKVKLSGKAPNTQAVGALVTVHFDGFALRRSVHAGATFMGTAESDRVPIFGLGKATAVEKVVIRWPLGKVQEIPGERVVIDSTLVVEEG